MKKLITEVIRKIIYLLTRGSSRPECVTVQKSTPEADWASIRNCIISIEDPSISSRRVTLHHAGEGVTNFGAPVHWFRLQGSKIEMGVAPDVKNPQHTWIHCAKGFSMSTALFVDNKRIPVRREWRMSSPSSPLRIRRPSIA